MANKHKILQCLEYSKNARLDRNELKLIYPNAYFFEDKDTDTQGYTLFENGKLVIAFRGTQQLRDWLTDINALHMIFPYGNLDTNIMVHRGFMIAYLRVRNVIHSIIKTNSLKIQDITITGHSLGGALATLCAVDLQYNFNHLIDCYVSGNPMVGNSHFVTSYNRRVPLTIRTYMRKDIVPKMPPEWFEGKTYEGYAHAGKPIAIGPSSPFLGIVTWFKKLFKKPDGFFDDLFNHDIDLYKTEVEKLKS